MNENLKEIEISGIRKFFNKVQNVEGAISLTLGQPDFETPKAIKDGMIRAIEEDKTVYTANAGLIELREEIVKYLKKINIDYSKDEICISVGGSEALFSVFISLLNKGDKVLIPTPAYPAYENIVRLLGGEVVNYTLDNKFEIDVQKLKNTIINEKIEYIVLSYPCNPTGAILNPDKYNELVDLIKETNICVITDEIYSSLCYEKYLSLAQNKELKNNIIYINGFSKMFSFTGLRVGYFCAPKHMMDEFMKSHQYNVSCATSISQWGAYYGLKESLSDVEEMKSEFKVRRDYVVDRLNNMGLEVVEPKGAFYVFPSIKKFNLTSDEFCEKLLYEYKVAMVPGTAFGAGGEGYIRLSYCYSIKDIEIALDKLEEMIISL
ncbi:MAG: aminotransferase class I/II-fold pyridoxal phosphate-dependent enzyme [Clostridium sp.]